VVTGRWPGPAMWKVSRGDSAVFVMSAVTPIPHLQQWETMRVEHALDGANTLIMRPTQAKVGLFEGIGMLLNNGALHLPRGRTLESVLPPPDRARFLAVAKEIHQDPKKYEHWKPALAGFALLGDFLRAAGLSAEKPGTTVQKLARSRGVPVREYGQLRAGAMIKALGSMPEAAHITCFEAALREIDRESAHARPAAEAWAKGDLQGVRANYSLSSVEACVQAVPSLRDAVERSTADAARALEEALKRPGKSVAVIDLTLLLRANGVLDRLKAAGATITVPQS